MPTPPRRRWLSFSLRSAMIAVAILSLLLACIGNPLRIYYSEQRLATEVRNAGGGYETSLFGFMPADNPNGWEAGPRLLHRVVAVTLSGSSINDEQLARLQLHRLKHLRSLSIGYDAVYGADGPKWEDMPAPITDRGLSELPAFVKLRLLNLRDLPVSDVGLSGLAERYPNLEWLDVKGTQVSDAGMAEIGRLARLIVLRIDDTQVTDSGLVHLAQLKDMRALSMNETSVTGSGLIHLVGMSQLNTLELRATGVSDDDVSHLSRLTRLRTLGLEGTRISNEGVGSLATLLELKYLGLRDTAVTDTGVTHLVRLPQLAYVDLTGTLVTDKGLLELAKMPSLNCVYIDGSRVTMNGVDEFLRGKPDRSAAYNNQWIRTKDRQESSK